MFVTVPAAPSLLPSWVYCTSPVVGAIHPLDNFPPNLEPSIYATSSSSLQVESLSVQEPFEKPLSSRGASWPLGQMPATGKYLEIAVGRTAIKRQLTPLHEQLK